MAGGGGGGGEGGNICTVDLKFVTFIPCAKDENELCIEAPYN